MVAEYLTDLPPKTELEKRLHEALIEARERLAARDVLADDNETEVGDE